MLASVAEQASLKLTRLETPEDIFSWRDSFLCERPIKEQEKDKS